ncbi:MAG: hypothetical protein HKM93_00885 [Desulfobacteraceae bacterium]|nr:hypothetical protein [Desulfobacteraceae bacterium]
MYAHPAAIETMMKERHGDLLRYAEKERVINTLKLNLDKRPRMRARAILKMAEFLISTGSKIKRKYNPLVYPGTEAYGTSAKRTYI